MGYGIISESIYEDFNEDTLEVIELSKEETDSVMRQLSELVSMGLRFKQLKRILDA